MSDPKTLSAKGKGVAPGHAGSLFGEESGVRLPLLDASGGGRPFVQVGHHDNHVVLWNGSLGGSICQCFAASPCTAFFQHVIGSINTCCI